MYTGGFSDGAGVRTTIRLPQRMKRAFEPDAFAAVRAMDGRTFRRHKHRRTFRVCLDGEPYFVKYHGPSGWGEILKHIARGRMPVLTARPERRAAAVLRRLGVPTVRVRGFGMRAGLNPAAFASFLVLESLESTRPVSELLAERRRGVGGPAAGELRRIIEKVADSCRILHESGVNHRDLYLEHFRWDPAGEVYLIDLHRVQIRRCVPRRWLVKDLAALLFSSIDLIDSRRELLRFVERYAGRPWRAELAARPGLWRAVIGRAGRLYRREHGRLMRDLAVPTGGGTLPGLWAGHAKSRSE